MFVENTRKVSSNLCCKKDCLDKKPEHRVKVLMPEVIHVYSSLIFLAFSSFFLYLSLMKFFQLLFLYNFWCTYLQSTERVLILEYMDGVRLNDSPSLDKLGVDKKNIVEEITRAYAHQIFIDGFFNADPHPGNFSIFYILLNILFFSNTFCNLWLCFYR